MLQYRMTDANDGLVDNPNMLPTNAPAPTPSTGLHAELDYILAHAASTTAAATEALKKAGLARLKKLAGKTGLKIKSAAGMNLPVLIVALTKGLDLDGLELKDWVDAVRKRLPS